MGKGSVLKEIWHKWSKEEQIIKTDSLKLRDMSSSSQTDQEDRGVSRRNFLRGMALVGAAAGGAVGIGEGFLPAVNAAGSLDVQSASYVVYIDGTGTVSARNGTTGVVDYSGTNAATVIQNAWNQVMAGTGRIYIRKGTYSLGTTSLVASDPSSLWEMIFEPGAKLTYSGTDFALKINAATRGNIQQFNLENVNIQSSGTAGGCIQSRGGYLFGMRSLRLFNSGNGPVTCLDLDNLNSGYVTGGWLNGPWTPSNPIGGTAGLRIANSVGDTSLVRVFSTLISGCEKGVQLGTSPDTSSKSAAAIKLLSAEIASNKYGIYAYVGQGIGIEHCWFENQASDSIVIDNPDGSNTPAGWEINYNAFNEFAGVNDLRVTNYLYYLRAQGNNWGAGNVALTQNTGAADVDIATLLPAQLTMGGAVPASFLLFKTLGVMTKAGMPTDEDFKFLPTEPTRARDGLLVVDTANNRLWIRSGGNWISA